MSCSWCLRQSPSSDNYGNGFEKKRDDITLERAKEILSFFPKAGHVNFAGFGEPLMVNDLFRINAEFKKRQMRTSIITNGTLLLDRLNEVLQANFKYISISLNSLDAKNYAIICGSSENTFYNVLKGIQLLVERRKSSKPRVHISFVLTRDLFNRTPEIVKLAQELHVDCLDLHNVISHNNYNDYDNVLTTDDKEVAAKISEWKNQKYTVHINWPTLVKKGLEKPVRICKPLWNWLGIDMEGNTAGCHKAMGTDKKYGNIFKEGNNVWNNDFRKNLRKSFVDGCNFLYDCCRTCVVGQP
ncbi:MAG: hypothetical protein E3K37_12800 [Candidatus Kuenenia sp.]|nr:hypothetical protein [Candidatus Kuenenia hertensis]